MREYKNLGKFLKECRLKKSLTQIEVGQKLGIHSQFVSNWERGLCTPPGASFQELISYLSINRGKLVEAMLRDSKATIEAKIYKGKKTKFF